MGKPSKSWLRDVRERLLAERGGRKGLEGKPKFDQRRGARGQEAGFERLEVRRRSLEKVQTMRGRWGSESGLSGKCQRAVVFRGVSGLQCAVAEALEQKAPT